MAFDEITHEQREILAVYRVAEMEMPASCKLPWVCGGQIAAKKAPKVESKVRFTCPGCHQNAWGKPGLLILCATCLDGSRSNVPMKKGG